MDNRKLVSIEDMVQLEQALEKLGEGKIPDNLSQNVEKKLQEYLQVIEYTKNLFPEQEPREGLFAGVLQEAHRSVAAQTKAELPKKVSFRKRWIPVFALLGSAALVLLLVRNTHQSQESVAQKSAPSILHKPPSESAKGMLGNQITKPEESAIAANLSDKDKIESASEMSEGFPQATKATSKQEFKGFDVKFEQEDSNEKAPLKKTYENLSEIMLQQADNLRVTKKCEQALKKYQQVLARESQGQLRAKALAGQGLCQWASGSTQQAEETFKEAKIFDQNIEAYVREQQIRMENE